MITITKKDLEDFIMEQPDEKLLDMNNNINNGDCGCLAIQYMQAKNPEIQAFAAYLTTIGSGECETVAESEVRFDTWCSWTFEGTYKQLREQIASRQNQPDLF